jgi:hypothetical protein
MPVASLSRMELPRAMVFFVWVLSQMPDPSLSVELQFSMRLPFE